MSKEIVEVPSDGWTLHGIAGIPDEKKLGKRIGVILFYDDAGSKFGTHSLYKKVADALTKEGYFTLRCDNRGLCDSPEINDLTFDVRVKDAINAMAFFRQHYDLEVMAAWGLCVGSAVALHAASKRRRDAQPDAIVLCNILGDPTIVSTPELGFGRTDPKRILTDMFLKGNLLKKLWEAPTKLHIYRQNWPKMARGLYARYITRVPQLDEMRTAIGQVPGMLVAYEKPHLLMYGEVDNYRAAFLERVNPNDKLGLAKKATPPHWVTVVDGNHTFASAAQTRDAIRFSIEWLDAFVSGRDPGPEYSFSGRENGVRSSSAT